MISMTVSETGKGFDVRCDEQERTCKICKKQYVEAPCHICPTIPKGLLCKNCEPPIEFYDGMGVNAGKILHTLSEDNPNLPKISIAKQFNNVRFKCGCEHVDASDAQTSIVTHLAHPRVNTINGMAIKHEFQRPREYVEKDSLFMEIENSQGSQNSNV